MKHFNNAFTETGILDKQECYLKVDLNTNLIVDEEEIPATTLLKRVAKTNPL